MKTYSEYKSDMDIYKCFRDLHPDTEFDEIMWNETVLECLRRLMKDRGEIEERIKR